MYNSQDCRHSVDLCRLDILGECGKEVGQRSAKVLPAKDFFRTHEATRAASVLSERGSTRRRRCAMANLTTGWQMTAADSDLYISI